MRFLSCAAAVLFVMSGCGGPKTAPVSGVITKDGTPLANASVTFTPAALGNEAPASSGRTDAAGRYSLSITVTGKPGAVLGKHAVQIAMAGEASAGPTPDVIDPNWVNPI